MHYARIWPLWRNSHLRDLNIEVNGFRFIHILLAKINASMPHVGAFHTVWRVNYRLRAIDRCFNCDNQFEKMWCLDNGDQAHVITRFGIWARAKLSVTQRKIERRFSPEISVKCSIWLHTIEKRPICFWHSLKIHVSSNNHLTFGAFQWHRHIIFFQICHNSYHKIERIHIINHAIYESHGLCISTNNMENQSTHLLKFQGNPIAEQHDLMRPNPCYENYSEQFREHLVIWSRFSGISPWSFFWLI